MGGEKNDHLVVFKLTEGSPPHGRGKAAGGHHRAPKRGITPAWAGKSVHVFSFRWWVGDHPRMGGEKVVR